MYYIVFGFAFWLWYVVYIVFVFVKVLFGVPAWRLKIKVTSAQHNGGILSDVIVLTQCYYHQGTRLNAMKRFCLCSL